MKKLLFILLVFLFSININAQKYNRGFTDVVDTLQGADTLTFAFAAKIVKHTGFVAFNYTIANIEDSLNALIMQGSMDNSNWSTVATKTVKTDTFGLLTEEAPDYLYYRLFMSTATGDTVNVTAVNFIYKED
jgi:hypothetical protein